jgi:hypothetical protein
MFAVMYELRRFYIYYNDTNLFIGVKNKMPFRRSSFFIGFMIVIGILIGILEATLWFTGLIPNIRDIIPYAVADALLIVMLTVLIALFYRRGEFQVIGAANADADHYSSNSLSNFVTVIMIAAAIFLIFIQIFVGATPVNPLKTILAFIGSTSFWVMFVVFIQFVFWIVRRR